VMHVIRAEQGLEGERFSVTRELTRVRSQG